MDDAVFQQFFLAPRQPQQRRYEALRAYFVDRQALPDIARRFGYSHGTLRNMVSEFRAHFQAGQALPFFFRLRGDDPAAPPRTPRGRKPPRSPTVDC